MSRQDCKAYQVSDQMTCPDCGLTWDMNDPEPPTCAPKHKRSPLTEAFESIISDNDPLDTKFIESTGDFNSDVDTESSVLEFNEPVTHSVPVSRVLLPVVDELNWQSSKNLPDGLYVSGKYLVSLVRRNESPISVVTVLTYFASSGDAVREVKVTSTRTRAVITNIMRIRTFDAKTKQWSNYSKAQAMI